MLINLATDSRQRHWPRIVTRKAGSDQPASADTTGSQTMLPPRTCRPRTRPRGNRLAGCARRRGAISV
jgi:hypothetical protein